MVEAYWQVGLSSKCALLFVWDGNAGRKKKITFLGTALLPGACLRIVKNIHYRVGPKNSFQAAATEFLNEFNCAKAL